MLGKNSTEKIVETLDMRQLDVLLNALSAVIIRWAILCSIESCLIDEEEHAVISGRRNLHAVISCHRSKA